VGGLRAETRARDRVEQLAQQLARPRSSTSSARSDRSTSIARRLDDAALLDELLAGELAIAGPVVVLTVRFHFRQGRK
jgi:hypothetical protein